MTAFAECLAAGVRALNAWTGAIPQYEGTFCSSGLGLENAADAQILRDENGIPTVLGSTANDIFALHGVCLGQDRLWQLHQTRSGATPGASCLLETEAFRGRGVGKCARGEDA